jgi:hypothetical protein
MTCKDCSDIQDGKIPYKEYYVRIEEANLLLVGCTKHVTIAIERLRLGATK